MLVFDFRSSKEFNTILLNFQGCKLVFSGISKDKATNLKFQRWFSKIVPGLTKKLYAVCSYHVTYTSNVKELLARSRREIWPNVLVWPNGWVFVYELSASVFKSSCSHLNCMLFMVLCYANWKKISLCIGLYAEFSIYITGLFMRF